MVGLLMFELGREIHGLPYKPPATLSLIAANTIIFLCPSLLTNNPSRIVISGGLWPNRILGLLWVATKNAAFRWSNLAEVFFRLAFNPFIHFDGTLLYETENSKQHNFQRWLFCKGTTSTTI
jgi:membrane associated rhomboid family serine protease